MRNDESTPASSGEHIQRMLQDWYYASAGPPPGGAGVWQALPNDLVPFELYDDATPGATDLKAWPLDGTLARDNSTDPPILTLSDQVLGDVRAYGSNHDYGSGPSESNTGAKGFYVLGNNRKNQIVAIQRLARRCKALTTASVLSGIGFSVNNVVPLDDGQSPVTSTSGTLNVANWCGWSCSTSGVDCEIVSDGAGGWRFAQGPCGS